MFITQKTDTKFSKIRSGSSPIPDPGSGFFSISDPGSRGKKSPDSGSGSATLEDLTAAE
jgi:hypothetical protein